MGAVKAAMPLQPLQCDGGPVPARTPANPCRADCLAKGSQPTTALPDYARYLDGSQREPPPDDRRPAPLLPAAAGGGTPAPGCAGVASYDPKSTINMIMQADAIELIEDLVCEWALGRPRAADDAYPGLVDFAERRRAEE